MTSIRLPIIEGVAAPRRSSGAVPRSAVAIVLLVAAGLKAQAIQFAVDGGETSAGWEVMARAIEIGAECVIATWLISGIARRSAWYVTMALLGIFVAVTGWRLVSGKADCGCFGNLHVRPVWTFSLDAAMLFVLYVFARSPAATLRQPAAALRAICSRLIVATVISSSVVLATLLISDRVFAIGQMGQIEVLDPQSQAWIGKPLRLLEYVDSDSRVDLMKGRRTVVLFNRDCDTCIRFLKQLESTSRLDGGVADVRIIEIRQTAANVPDFSTSMRQIHLRGGVSYFVRVPMEISLRDGIVQAVH